MLQRCFTMILLICWLFAGCAQLTYQQTEKGSFAGQLDVRWIEANRFIYIPNPDAPLSFTTSQKKVIRPELMYTDGGSIPRFFWNVPGYSPWQYAPAYIIHDWLFEQHHCKLSDSSFEESATVLAEAIKTIMESGKAPRDETTLLSIYEAVRSPIARAIWDRENACNRPKDVLRVKGALTPGTRLFNIDMSDMPKQ